MKLRVSFEIVDMGNESVAVPVGPGADQIHGVVKLNSEGREILELLKKDITENEIIDVLSSKYENNRDDLADSVHKVVRILIENKLIED